MFWCSFWYLPEVVASPACLWGSLLLLSSSPGQVYTIFRWHRVDFYLSWVLCLCFSIHFSATAHCKIWGKFCPGLTNDQSWTKLISNLKFSWVSWKTAQQHVCNFCLSAKQIKYISSCRILLASRKNSMLRLARGVDKAMKYLVRVSLFWELDSNDFP